MRDRPAQPASSGRGTGRSDARRRDAGAHARGLESEAPSMASSTAARSPTGERARRRASRGGAALPAPPGHHGQWPSPPRSVEREGGGENDARVWGAATATRFCSGENRGRPSDPNQRPRERLAFWAGKRPRRAGEGTPRRAVSAAWPLAVGPRAQGRVAEQAAGRFCSWAAEQCFSFYCFFYFSRSNFNSFFEWF